MSTPLEFPRVEIVTYRPEYRPAFEALNRVWLEAYSLLEPADLDYLRDPEARIVAPGGQVFFAVQAGTVVGTCAAIRITPAVFELAKLVVAPSAQGLGLGRRLVQTVLAFARSHGAIEVVLTSNSALVHAIRLYESLGFRHQPLPADSRYQTADVAMVLALRPAGA